MLVDCTGIMFADHATAPIDEDALERIVATNLPGPIRTISAFIEHRRPMPDHHRLVDARLRAARVVVDALGDEGTRSWRPRGSTI